MKSKQFPFLLITIALFLLAVSPRWLSDGMFCDGLSYAVISKNLAHGLGSFWDLFFTSDFERHFRGQPSLAFGLESLFFRILGDGYLVERGYSFVTYLVTGFVLVRVWKHVAGKQYFAYYWLPLLLWLSVPVVIWGISNNMLENTMTIFTSLAVLFGVKSYQEKRVVNTILSGIMVFLAVMSKGPVGLFPMALPFWVFVLNKKVSFNRFLQDTALLIAALTGSFLVLFILFPASIENLMGYLYTQVIYSVTNVSTVSSRFYILNRFLTELVPMFVAFVLLAVITRQKKWAHHNTLWGYILFLISLSGVIPIMVSMKQSGFYLLPVFPLVALAFGLYMVPEVKLLTDRINVSKKGFAVFKYFAFFLLVLSLIVNLLQINKTGRDKEILHDVYLIESVVPHGMVVAVEPSIINDWLVVGYFWRNNIDCLNAENSGDFDYLIVNKNYSDSLIAGFQRVSVDLKKFDLYRRH